MAALTVGNKSSVEQYVGSAGTITHSHTVAAGTNRILLVTASLQEIGGSPVLTMTYNGSALTAVTNSEENTGVTWERVKWFYLIGPSTGANNLVVTMGASPQAANVTVDVADYSNYDGSAPTGNFRSHGSSVSSLNTGSIAYTDGDVIGAATVHGINGKTVSWTNATEYSDNDFESLHQSTAFYTATGAGNITITATPSATEGRMALSAVRISPASATPVVESVSQIYPGGLVTVALSGYASAPLTANCTLNGVGITLEAGASTTGCTFYAPAESTYLYGGARASHRWYTNSTLTIANGTDTANSTVQVTAASSDQIAARSASALVNPIDSYNGGLTVATSDDVYQYSSPADSFTPYPATNDFTALEPAFTLYTKFYDVSASSWSSLTSLAFPTASPVGTGTLTATVTQIAQNPPGTLVPGTKDLTIYGAVDWIKTGRTAAATYDTKSGGTLIGTPSSIGTPAWTRFVTGDLITTPTLSWTDGAELGNYAGDANVDYTSVVGAGSRIVISPAGVARKVYIWRSAYQGVARVDVSFSDSSATPLQLDLTAATGVVEAQEIELEILPTGGAATCTIDITFASGAGNAAWQGIAVQNATASALFSLTSSDTTVMPGDTITATLVGGPFAGAITAAYIVYGVHEIPVSWTVLTPSTTSLTMPSLSSFVAGQSAEYLPWYANFTLRIVAGAESADSANTNQVIAPNDDGSYVGYLAARALPSEISSAFVRASNASDTDPSGVLSVVSSGVPAYDGYDGLILEAARTQLQWNTVYAGAVTGTPGTVPTNHTLIQNGGSLTTGTSRYPTRLKLTLAATAARQVLQYTTPNLATSTTYTRSLVVDVNSGSPQFQSLLTVAAGGATPTITARRVNGVAANATDVVTGSNKTLEICYTVASASTVLEQFGVGVDASATASVTFDLPQTEAGSFRSSHIINTSTVASLVRVASYIGPGLLSAMGIASQTNEYTMAVLWSPLMTSGTQNPSDYPILISLGATAANARLEVSYNPNSARIYGNRVEAGSYLAQEVSTSGGALTFTPDDMILTRMSWGATNGLVMVNHKVGSSNIISSNSHATLQAASAVSTTGAALAAKIQSGTASAAALGENYQAIRLWDRALSQAELEALTPDDLIPIGDYGTADAPPWGYPPSGAQENDDVYIHVVSGAGTPTAKTFDFVESEPSSFRVHVFNLASASWLAVNDVNFANNGRQTFSISISMRI